MRPFCDRERGRERRTERENKRRSGKRQVERGENGGQSDRQEEWRWYNLNVHMQEEAFATQLVYEHFHNSQGFFLSLSYPYQKAWPCFSSFCLLIYILLFAHLKKSSLFFSFALPHKKRCQRPFFPSQRRPLHPSLFFL